MSSGGYLARNERSLEHTDRMSPGLRACVHEFGYAIVKAMLQAGVSNPSHIREIMRAVWEGPRSALQRPDTASALDWLLLQAGCSISASTLARFLVSKNMLITHRFPTREMVDASMAEVSGGNVLCTKRDKHTRRLTAALSAAENIFDPKRFGGSV